MEGSLEHELRGVVHLICLQDGHPRGASEWLRWSCASIRYGVLSLLEMLSAAVSALWKKRTIMSNPARTFQGITLALTTNKPRFKENQQSERAGREDNSPEERIKHIQTQCPYLCAQEACLGYDKNLVNWWRSDHRSLMTFSPEHRSNWQWL